MSGPSEVMHFSYIGKATFVFIFLFHFHEFLRHLSIESYFNKSAIKIAKRGDHLLTKPTISAARKAVTQGSSACS